jgi:hypothetical protein
VTNALIVIGAIMVFLAFCAFGDSVTDKDDKDRKKKK